MEFHSGECGSLYLPVSFSIFGGGILLCDPTSLIGVRRVDFLVYLAFYLLLG